MKSAQQIQSTWLASPGGLLMAMTSSSCVKGGMPRKEVTLMVEVFRGTFILTRPLHTPPTPRHPVPPRASLPGRASPHLTS